MLLLKCNFHLQRSAAFVAILRSLREIKLTIMLRRSFIQNTALSFGALTFAQQNLLSSLFEDPWKITMLRNDVGIFTERGGTIAFLLTKKGIAVVDSQFEEQSKH